MLGITYHGAAPVEDRKVADLWTSTDRCRCTELTKAHMRIHPRYRVELTSRLRAPIPNDEGTRGRGGAKQKEQIVHVYIRGLSKKHPFVDCNIHLHRHVFTKTHIK